MAATAPPTPSAAPAVPDRSDRPTFSARATAFFDYVKNTMWTELVAMATNVYNNAVYAYSQAVAATTQVDLATAQANIAIANAAASQASADASAASAGAAVWVSGFAHTAGMVRYSPINQRMYRCINATNGTTDPSADPANWALIQTAGDAASALAILQSLNYYS